jgi:hypothetical protein
MRYGHRVILVEIRPRLIGLFTDATATGAGH